MPGQIVLIHAVPGTGLSETVNTYISHIKEDPFGSWLILPTHRLIRMVRDQLIKSGITFLPDHICTPDDLCRYLIDRYGDGTVLIKPETSRLLLVDLLKKHQDELTLFFAQKNPSPRAVQDLQILMQVIIRREIDYPACLGPLQSEKSHQISLLISAYQHILSENNLVDQDTLLSWTIDFLKKRDPTDIRSIIRHVHIFGLFEPMPLEKRLICTLGEVGETLHYTLPDGKDPDIFSDTGDWLSYGSEEVIPSTGMEQQMTTIFCHDPSGNDDYLNFPHISGMGFSDPATEMREVIREIVRLHEIGVSYEDIAIATPDFRSTRVYALEACTDSGIPVRPSQGSLLQSSPLIAYYLSIFDLIEKGMRYDELVRVIQSPYCRFRWEPEEDADQKSGDQKKSGKRDSRYKYLSYKNFDLLCRTYGLDGGHIDWEKRLPDVLLFSDDEGDEQPLPDGQGFVQSKKPVSRTYHPRRPLEKQEIADTIEGIIRLVGIIKRLRDKRTIREHIWHFKTIIKEIGSPVPGLAHANSLNAWLTDEEYLDLSCFHTLLSELQDLSGTGVISYLDPAVPVTFIDFIGAVRHVLQEKSGSVSPDASGVILTGIREIAHQHYPYVFLVSLNEGQIPRLTTRLPFTNSSENSRMDTRTLSDILRQEKYQFITALAAGTTHLYLSWYEHKDERTVLSSVFIDYLKSSTLLPEWGRGSDEGGYSGFPGDMEASYSAGVCIHNSEWERSRSYIPEDVLLSSLVQRISIERTYRFRLNRSEYDGIIGDDLIIRSALHSQFSPAYSWSASMLETYAKCPFRFYLERVLHIRPLPDIGIDIPPETKGNLIHVIMSRFKRTMHENCLLPIKEAGFDTALSLIRDIAEEECDKVPYTTPLWIAKKRQIMGGEDIGGGILERFIMTEIDRLSPDEDGRVPHQFTPRFFEYSFGAVRGPDDDPDSRTEPVDLLAIQRELKKSQNPGQNDRDTSESENSIRFIGKIDRIDLTPDGLFGIIDYKTGKNIPGSSDLTRMTALQLPLYLLAYQHISSNKPVFGSYIQLQRKILHSIPLYDPTLKQTLPKGKLPRSEPRWQEILENALHSSISHVHDIRDGLFPIQATTECNADWYCPYKTICRFQPDRGSQLGEWYRYPSVSDVCLEEAEA